MKNIVRGVRSILYFSVDFLVKVLPVGQFSIGLIRFVSRVDRPLRAYVLRGSHEI
jgi:hypothetical protein